MRGLTNLERSDENAFRTYVAALRSGQNVRYIDAPMPPETWERGSFCGRAYYTGGNNHLASIVGFEPIFDYSAFWQEWRNLGNGSY